MKYKNEVLALDLWCHWVFNVQEIRCDFSLKVVLADEDAEPIEDYSDTATGIRKWTGPDGDVPFTEKFPFIEDTIESLEILRTHLSQEWFTEKHAAPYLEKLIPGHKRDGIIQQRPSVLSPLGALSW